MEVIRQWAFVFSPLLNTVTLYFSYPGLLALIAYSLHQQSKDMKRIEYFLEILSSLAV